MSKTASWVKLPAPDWARPIVTRLRTLTPTHNSTVTAQPRRAQLDHLSWDKVIQILYENNFLINKILIFFPLHKFCTPIELTSSDMGHKWLGDNRNFRPAIEFFWPEIFFVDLNETNRMVVIYRSLFVEQNFKDVWKFKIALWRKSPKTTIRFASTTSMKNILRQKIFFPVKNFDCLRANVPHHTLTNKRFL